MKPGKSSNKNTKRIQVATKRIQVTVEGKGKKIKFKKFWLQKKMPTTKQLHKTEAPIESLCINFPSVIHQFFGNQKLPLRKSVSNLRSHHLSHNIILEINYACINRKILLELWLVIG